MSIDGSKIESRLINEAKSALEYIIAECRSTLSGDHHIARCMDLWNESVALLTTPQRNEFPASNDEENPPNEEANLQSLARLQEFNRNDLRVYHNKSTIVKGMEGLRAFLEKSRRDNRYLPNLVLKFKHKGENMTDYDELPTVMFCFDGDPMPGWHRLLYLRLSGKTKGRVDIHYRSPENSHRIRSRSDLIPYSLQSNLTVGSSFPIDRFSFSVPFCVCQQPEAADSPLAYIECSHGKCGCNGWVHPVCVGLGNCSEEEMQRLPRIICPFCTAYLEATDSLQQFTSKGILPLRYLTTDYKGELIRWKTIEVEACNIPHQIYGRNCINTLNRRSFGMAVSPREQYWEPIESLQSSTTEDVVDDGKPNLSIVGLVARPNAITPTTLWTVAPSRTASDHSSRRVPGLDSENRDCSVQRKRLLSSTAAGTAEDNDNWSWSVRDPDNLFKRRRLLPSWCLSSSMLGNKPLLDDDQEGPGRWIGVSGGFLSMDHSWFPSTSTTYSSAFIAAVKPTEPPRDLVYGEDVEQEKESDLLYLQRKALQRIYRQLPSSDEPKPIPAVAPAVGQTVGASDTSIPLIVPAETHKSMRARFIETLRAGALRSVKALVPKQADQTAAYNEQQAKLFGRALELKDLQTGAAGHRADEDCIFLPPVMHFPAKDGGVWTVPVPLPTRQNQSLWDTTTNSTSAEEVIVTTEVAESTGDAIVVGACGDKVQVRPAEPGIQVEQSSRRRRVPTGIGSASELIAFVEQMHRVSKPNATLSTMGTVRKDDNIWLQQETKRQRRCAICLQRLHGDPDESLKVATVDGRRCHAACAWAWQQASFLRDLCGADCTTAAFIRDSSAISDGVDAVDVPLTYPTTWPPSSGSCSTRMMGLRVVRSIPATVASGQRVAKAPMQRHPTDSVGEEEEAESKDIRQPKDDPSTAVGDDQFKTTEPLTANSADPADPADSAAQPRAELYWDEDTSESGGEHRLRKQQVCALCAHRDDFSCLIDVRVSPLPDSVDSPNQMNGAGDGLPSIHIQAHMPCLQHACFAPQALEALLVGATSGATEVSCDICRSNSGPLLLRCVADGCTVRMHSLCAEIFGQTKMLHTTAVTSASGKAAQRLCLLCPVHKLNIDQQGRKTNAPDTRTTEQGEAQAETFSMPLTMGEGGACS